MFVGALFGWSPETWTAIGTLALAGVTFMLVLAGPVGGWIRRARLRLEIRTRPPDSHMIEMTHRDTGASLGKTLYLRARVSHRRGKAAENVEVLAASLWSEDDSGHREPAPGFLPLNLTWSHVGGATIRIPRKLFRHCDVGHFANVNGETTLFLDTIAQPNPVAGGDLPTVRWPGRYVLELQLSGDNVKTISRRWRIEFRPAWSDDEASMLERIRVERV